jgi:SMP-30/Gluconolactonase/LRE-like region
MRSIPKNQILPLVKTTTISDVRRVIHPTHRWRNNFEKIATGLSEFSFVAPDGVTIIPNTFDLSRSVQLMAVVPNQAQPVFVTHEDTKTTYRFQVDGAGQLTHPTAFVARGEYGNISDQNGNLYLAEGHLIVLDKKASEIKRINVDERIHSLTWGGKNNRELFVTTSTSVYKVNVNEKKP